MRYHHVMSDYYFPKLVSKLLDSIRASQSNLIWEEKNIPTHKLYMLPLISQFHHIEFTTMKTMNDVVHNGKQNRKNHEQKVNLYSNLIEFNPKSTRKTEMIEV